MDFKPRFPWRRYLLISVIIPQSFPAITAVTLVHFFFVWNDYFSPLVYLVGREDLYPISVGIGQFVTTFGSYPGRAAAITTVLCPRLSRRASEAALAEYL